MSEPSYQERMRTKLQASLRPMLLEIKDDSARHAGHAGHDPNGETHFLIKIVSEKFEGLKPVERHRLVYVAVDAELKERVHALSLNLLSIKEYNHR